ncbi:MAG: hypothetical protein FWD88_06510 [Treponema sp.]|nr:hypothetical protein [Treponema sp.]
MTLSNRNTVFKAGIAISALCLLIGIIASIETVPVYEHMEAEITLRPDSFAQAFLERHFETRLLAVHFTVLLLALYALLSIVFIYFFFEKTQAPEIFFVAFFAASFAPEVLRLVLPLGRVYEIPSLYLLMASRIILFGRYFGIFSLFAASVYAAGYQSQQQRNAVLIIVATALFVSLSVPVDTQTWDSSLTMISGYASMFGLIGIGTFLITVASFFIAARQRGSGEFIFIGIGSVLALIGRNILLRTDTWVGLPIGMLFLAAGTWLICTRLHRIYLWL